MLRQSVCCAVKSRRGERLHRIGHMQACMQMLHTENPDIRNRSRQTCHKWQVSISFSRTCERDARVQGGSWASSFKLCVSYSMLTQSPKRPTGQSSRTDCWRLLHVDWLRPAQLTARRVMLGKTSRFFLSEVKCGGRLGVFCRMRLGECVAQKCIHHLQVSVTTKSSANPGGCLAVSLVGSRIGATGRAASPSARGCRTRLEPSR